MCPQFLSRQSSFRVDCEEKKRSFVNLQNYLVFLINELLRLVMFHEGKGRKMKVRKEMRRDEKGKEGNEEKGREGKGKKEKREGNGKEGKVRERKKREGKGK
jgi:hypothetical protein